MSPAVRDEDMPELVVFEGFDDAGDLLRARFRVIADGRDFTAWADLDAQGEVIDLHASDLATLGTTGSHVVDVEIRRRARAALIYARAAAVVANFDRRRDRARRGRR